MIIGRVNQRLIKQIIVGKWEAISLDSHEFSQYSNSPENYVFIYIYMVDFIGNWKLWHLMRICVSSPFGIMNKNKLLKF